MYIIGSNYYGQKQHRVFLHTSSTWLEEFIVYAHDECEAIDKVADYCEANKLHDLYHTHIELLNIFNKDRKVERYAKKQKMTCCGTHGIYIRVAAVTTEGGM